MLILNICHIKQDPSLNNGDWGFVISRYFGHARACLTTPTKMIGSVCSFHGYLTTCKKAKTITQFFTEILKSCYSVHLVIPGHT